jgi:hypothetical protein
MDELDFLIEKFRREVNEFLSEVPTSEDSEAEKRGKLLLSTLRFTLMSFTADALQKELIKTLNERVG